MALAVVAAGGSPEQTLVSASKGSGLGVGHPQVHRTESPKALGLACESGGLQEVGDAGPTPTCSARQAGPHCPRPPDPVPDSLLCPWDMGFTAIFLGGWSKEY